jgi:hypothetical protein
MSTGTLTRRGLRKLASQLDELAAAEWLAGDTFAAGLVGEFGRSQLRFWESETLHGHYRRAMAFKAAAKAAREAAKIAEGTQ